MWRQAIGVTLGVWLMFAPAVLGYGAPASTSDRIVGPLVASFAFIAASRITRTVGRMNLLAALWLLGAPWILGFPTDALVNSIVVGLAVGGVALFPPVDLDDFDGGWRPLLDDWS